MAEQPWRSHTGALGRFIRAQRRLADLSLREMATMADISNAYLSQVERGLHQPSLRVLSSIAHALNVPPDELLAAAGLVDLSEKQSDTQAPGQAEAAGQRTSSTEDAIASDPRLTDDQRQALLGVYRSFVPPEG